MDLVARLYVFFILNLEILKLQKSEKNYISSSHIKLIFFSPLHPIILFCKEYHFR